MDKKLTEMNAIQLRKNWGEFGHCRCLRRCGPRGSIFYLGEIAEVEGKDLWEGGGEKKGHTS